MTLTKTLGYAIAVAALAAFTGSAAWAQTSGSVPAVSASARIIPPITIEKILDLSFGTFVPGPAAGVGGTVIVSENGSLIDTTGDVTFFPGAAPATRAKFFVTGEDGFLIFTTTVSPTTVTLSNGNEPDGMDAELDFIGIAQTIPGVGNLFIYVGGTLEVAPGQTSDFYSGTFSVTVSYN